ncbi:MAG: class I SAM-dependent methyltransferase [Clostridium sp.]|nr:class I SAM-dependent methyltransferase [Clostridium sp.]
MYEILAKYYDDLMGDFDYDAYEKFALENLKDVWGGFGYDLASGSGEMAIRLKRNGFKVVGGDVSPEMLEKATEKARKARLDVQFVFSDLNDLHLEKKCDFVTAVCDGFNYVKGKNLAAAFNEIYSALNDGGIFIFDVSSANKLENVLGNNLFYEDDENLTYLWQNTKKGEKIKMDLTFFERDGDVYRRFDESESQYIHKTKDVESALTAAGFSYRLFNEKFKKFTERCNRLIVVAKK